MFSKVSLVRSNNSYDGTFAALMNIEEDILKRMKNVSEVVIKINLVTAVRKLATTPLSTVHAILEFLKDRYKGKITIAEAAVMGDTRIGYNVLGFNKLAKKYKASILDLDDDQTESIFLYGEGDSKLKVPYSKTHRHNIR